MIKAIRWILVPIVVLVCTAGFAAGAWFGAGYLDNSCPSEYMSGGFCNASYAPGLYDALFALAGFLMGFSALYLGARLAPAAKVIVAIALALIGAGAMYAYLDASWWQVALAWAYGAALALVLLIIASLRQRRAGT